MIIKCVFLDRDGVINSERGDYTYLPEDFILIDGVHEAIDLIKSAGYLAIIITNQAGISKGLYTRDEMNKCHQLMLEELSEIDAVYYSPYHPDQTLSLSRKPDSLLFEKALAKFSIDPEFSWMVGDRERDLIPAKKLNMRTVLIGTEPSTFADHHAVDLLQAVKEIILNV